MVRLFFPPSPPTPGSLTLRPNFSQSPAGTYSTGPLHGKLVDARGPRPSLVIAFFTLSFGYLGIKMIFDAGLKEGQERASAMTVTLLVICGFLTGTGGAGGATGALNTVAKSFPEHIVSVQNHLFNPMPMPTPRLSCAENQLYRVGVVWFWTFSLLVLYNRTLGLPWEHL